MICVVVVMLNYDDENLIALKISTSTVDQHIYHYMYMHLLVDILRCIKMALVHDLAESLIGDITPHDGVSKEEKFRKENVCTQLYKCNFMIILY